MYYVRIRGRVFGPLDENQIAAMVRQGKLGRMNEISTDNRQWVRADELEQFFPKHKPKRKPFDAINLPEDDADSNASESGSLRHDKSRAIAAPREPASAAVWFYSDDGKTGLGPFPQSEIVHMIEQGRIIGNTILWRDGLDPQTAETLPDFAAYFGNADADAEKDGKSSGRKSRKTPSRRHDRRATGTLSNMSTTSSNALSDEFFEQLGKASTWSFALALFGTIGVACLLFSQLFQFVVIVQSGSIALTLGFLLVATVIDLVAGYMIFVFWRYANAVKRASHKADEVTLSLFARRMAEFWRTCVIAPLVLGLFMLLVTLLFFTVGIHLMKAPLQEMQKNWQIEMPDEWQAPPPSF